MQKVNKNFNSKTFLNSKRGISLIALIITIIVIIILTAVAINGALGNGIVENANEAVFKSNASQYVFELSNYINNQLLKNNGTYDKTLLEVTKDTELKFKDVIPSMTEKDSQIFQVRKGELVYTGYSTKEIQWLKDLGMDFERTIVSEEGVLSGTKNFEYIYGKLEIPPEVTTITDGAFFNNDGLKEVDMSTNSNITVIPANAFAGCDNLEVVILPDGLKRIEAHAFRECRNLKKVVIPDSVEYIGIQAFYCCTNLTEVNLPQNDKYTNVSSYVFSDCSFSSINLPDNVISIGMYAFRGNTKLTTVNLGTGVSSIDGSAFSNCKLLTDINISVDNKNFASYDGVLYTANYKDLIFCPSNKTTVNINENTERILKSAFYGCTKISEITIPRNVYEIERPMFNTCIALSNLNVDSNNNNFTMVDGVLYSKDKKRVISSNGVLTDFVADTNAEIVEECAFKNLRTLKSVDMSKSKITDIQNEAFSACTSLKTLKLSNTLKNIRGFAFGYSCGFASLVLPETIETIETNAFFNNSYLDNITIPASVKTMGSAFSGCTNLNNITVSANNQYFSTDDGVIFNKDKTTIICLPNTKDTYVMPDTVKTLAQYSLGYLSKMKNLTLSKNLEKIEGWAFNATNNLEKLDIPSTIKVIESNAFSDCSSLKEININKAKDSVTGAPWGAPYGINAVHWN